jgi:molybdopterin converting factor small subunit
MISVKLSFYLTLGKEFGKDILLHSEYPINFFELFQLFSTQSGMKAAEFFLEKNFTLKEDFRILMGGRDIFGYDGLKTIINSPVEIDFFPKLGGG